MSVIKVKQNNCFRKNTQRPRAVSERGSKPKHRGEIPEQFMNEATTLSAEQPCPKCWEKEDKIKGLEQK